jgi:hypothetical protein
MNRQSRLQSAACLLKKYNGKQYIRGYSKYYRVDVGTAIVELRLLGVPLTDESVQRARAGAKASVKAKHARKQKRQLHLQEEAQSCSIDSDETYAYIAGYTAWGFPYGVTFEEMEQFADQDSLDRTAPPRIKKQYIFSADQECPSFEQLDAEEDPFDLEAFMRYYAGPES